MSPEHMREIIQIAIKHIRDHAYGEFTEWSGDSYDASEIVEDLNRAESTLYLLCESRKTVPLSKAPAGFESMGAKS